ncbi:MAG: sialidase family protein [Phycisphaerae bacterium]|nr:sialidase family protein [Phycisphaerae bacterium]
MKDLSTCVFLVLLLLGSSASPATAEGVDFRKDVFVRGTDGYHTYRIPTMVVTDKGTILVFCEGRKTSRRDFGDVDQIMKRSDDGGKTWSKQVLIHEEGGDAKIRVGNPCPIVERDGKVVHLLFTRGGGECLFYTKSVDDGKTWSNLVTTSGVPGKKEYDGKSFLLKLGGAPVTIAAGPVHGIQTKKGRLIAPCYGGRMVDGKRRGQSFIIYSDDSGKTWSAGGSVPFVEGLRTGECTILERSDGSLMMNLRTSAPGFYGLGYRAVSVSTDRGMTWSKPVLDKNLPSTGCQGSIIRLNEKEILFLNPAVHRKGGFSIRSRRNLTLRLSKDEGTSWPCSRVLNQKLAGYSDMAITKKGKILCLFENGIRDYCERISIVQLDRTWLAAGKDAETNANPK